MKHPYSNLPTIAFWKTAVGQQKYREISNLWQPKFQINEHTRVATFGSCFAQHFSRVLREKNYRWQNGEPAPESFESEDKRRFGYEMFSARTGNIYTSTLLRQWMSWAVGETVPSTEIWENDGRFYDPFRPTIEPNGFDSQTELTRSRGVAIDAFNSILKNSEVIVFTLGLTESWFNSENGTEYPLCPGTAAGKFDDKQHVFVNQTYEQVKENLIGAILLAKQLNRRIQFLLTVSPVPLTATNSNQHVLVATSDSKAILRAVAGSLAKEFDYIDYFPSFEIISNAVYRGEFYSENKRSVTSEGVAFVMKNFFECVSGKPTVSTMPDSPLPSLQDNKLSTIEDDLVHCDEELLGSFSKETDK